MRLLLGDCLERLKDLPDNSVDSIVTDPPYGLSFMGKKWDYDVPSEDVWRECLRVLKPGGHLLAFAGTRTQHRMAVRIEDAGFEIRDMIAWIYGSGFPKSLNIGKAVDKLQGNKRENLGFDKTKWRDASNYEGGKYSKMRESDYITKATITKGNSPHEGWGTALKPALEPITVARKPLGEKTVAENVLTHGTGGINIDGCRVGMMTKEEVARSGKSTTGMFAKGGVDWKNNNEPQGRFPANLIHDGSEEVVGLFPGEDDTSAARFFYAPKASKKDRDEGLEGFEEKPHYTEAHAKPNRDGRENVTRANHHPTVKPTDLMRYLCRLVTPPGGTVLDPFTGSGSTGKAALMEGFDFIGIERDYDYYQIAAARINAVDPKLFAA